MRSLLSFLFLLATLVASAQQAVPVFGTYKYVPDEATVEFCRSKKQPVPKGELVLRQDFTFALTVNDNDGVHKTLGRYQYEKDLVRFTVEEGDGNELPHLMRASKRGLNGRGAAFARVVIKVTVDPPAPAIDDKKQAPEVTAPVVPDEPTKLSLQDQIQGVWTVYRNGIEDRTIRITIRGKKWKFVWGGLASSGDLEFEDDMNTFILIYRMVDGEPKDGTMRKAVTLAEDGASFIIEKNTYRLASKQ